MSDTELTIFYLAVAILAICARISGELARRARLPVVLGEILTGVILGPTVLRHLLPTAQFTLFPHDGNNHLALVTIATLGVALFLLSAGMEVDLKLMRRQGRLAWPISLAGMAVPFTFAFVPCLLWPDLLGFHPATHRVIFAMFVGAALSITALPTSAKMLLDLNLYKTPFGMLIMSSAVVDDFVGWILVGIVFALDHLHDAHTFTGDKIATMIGATVGFVVIMLTAGRWLCHRLMPMIYQMCPSPGGVIGVILGMALLGASCTQAIGIHGLFGAFIVGIVVGSCDLKDETRQSIKQFVASFLAPIYFASMGLSVDFIAHFSWPTVVIILAIACMGKILGCFLVARWEKMSVPVSLAVGIAMNNRGGMEIILAMMALQEQIIDERMFVALAVMAVITSAVAGRVLERMVGILRSDDPLAPEKA